jgi:glycosyltransferase involved in cell wall biosynthesis
MGYRYLGLAPTIERMLRQHRVRGVFAHFGLNGAFALPFARRLGLPLTVLFHGHDVGGLLPVNRRSIRYFRYQRLAPELFAYASALLCASSELAGQLLAAGAPERKVGVHRLGIDLDRFVWTPPEAKPKEPLVLMVGRLVEKKGMFDGIAAFARAKARFPGARLHIVGDGPLRSALESEARRAQLTASISFLGALSSAEVQRQMQAAHVILAPSFTTARGDRESGVIVLKEAAASGLPAIGTRHGGIPEIIDHESTGLLVPERSVDELSAALCRLLDDPQLRERMGRAARDKMVRCYDNRRQVAALEETLLRSVRG